MHLQGLVPPVLRAFEAAANPILRQWLDLEPRSCIAATRVTLECLRHFGCRAEPQAVKFIVELPKREAVYMSGLSDAERADAQRTARSFQRLGSEDAWNGHLIVIADDQWILDPSFSQAEKALRPICEMGGGTEPIFLVPLMGSLSEGNGIRMSGFSETGEAVTIRYIHSPDISYLTAPAWDTDHIERLIQEIQRRMRVLLG